MGNGSIKAFKSPVPAGIYPALPQHLEPAFIRLLKGIFQASMRLNYIPSGWRKVRVGVKSSHIISEDKSFLLFTENYGKANRSA